MRHSFKIGTSNEMNPKALQALKEKRNAEKLIDENNYATAKDHLVKAKKIFPEFDNIEPMLLVCDILSAASVKFPGYGIDYYWILQITPTSTLAAIAKRRQKLVSLLQPIVRTFTGAELALKHIQDAFLVLSDDDTRSKFDLDRGMGWEDYRSINVQVPSTQSISDRETISTAQSSSVDSPSHCLDSSEKIDILSMTDRKYAEEQLSSVAFEDDENLHGSGGVPSKGILSMNSLPTISEEIDVCQDYYNFKDDMNLYYLEVGKICGAHFRAKLQHNYRYARITIISGSALCVTWLKPTPVTPRERRWCDNGLPVACGSFELVAEMKEEVSWQIISSHECSWIQGIVENQFDIYPRKGEIWALYKDWDLDDWSYDPNAVKECKFELVEIISEFSKYLGADAACLVKVNGFKSVFKRQTMGGNPITFHISPSNIYMFSHNVPAYRFRGGEIDNIVDGMFELDQMALPENMIQDMESQQSRVENRSVLPRSTPSLYPNPQSSTQKQLARGQVWAVYCGKDQLPRQYIRINAIMPDNHVCGTVLEPLLINDHEIEWQKQNLPIACGIFTVSTTTVNLEMSLLAYRVNCQLSSCNSFYKIYPQKGEIWAMYRNWNAKWRRSNHENYQCQIVQVLSGWEENGVKVAKLGEVKGYLTFFRKMQYDGFDLTYAVSKEKKLSFSHRIPAFRVPGIQKHGIPEDSWHLEPDALPPKGGGRRQCNS